MTRSIMSDSAEKSDDSDELLVAYSQCSSSFEQFGALPDL